MLRSHSRRNARRRCRRHTSSSTSSRNVKSSPREIRHGHPAHHVIPSRPSSSSPAPPHPPVGAASASRRRQVRERPGGAPVRRAGDYVGVLLARRRRLDAGRRGTGRDRRQLPVLVMSARLVFETVQRRHTTDSQ